MQTAHWITGNYYHHESCDVQKMKTCRNSYCQDECSCNTKNELSCP